MIEKLSKFNFPIKITENEESVINYCNSLTEGEEQVIVSREGKIYLSDGKGSYKNLIDINISNEILTKKEFDEFIDGLDYASNEDLNKFKDEINTLLTNVITEDDLEIVKDKINTVEESVNNIYSSPNKTLPTF